MSAFSALMAPARTVAIVAATVFAISSTAAGATCGLCDSEIVINGDLAACFLEKYDQLAKESDPAIVVDLSDCTSRGIVQSLPSVTVQVDEPDTQFMISKDQLACLRAKLEQPDLVLDPSAKIDLTSCS